MTTTISVSHYTRQQFAGRITAALRGLGEMRPIHYSAGDDRLLVGDPARPVYWMALGNAFDEANAAPPEDRDEVIRHFAQAAFSSTRGPVLPDRFDDARAHLYPRVNARIAYAPVEFPNDAKGRQDTFWHRPIGEHLAVGLAFDLPYGIVEITEGMLSNWGVAGEEAYRLACENLRGHSTLPFESPAPGVFVSPAGDDYGTSRIIFADVIQKLDVKGDPVALVPDRDTLIVTGADDPEGLRVMLRLAEQAFRRPYRVSGVAIRLRDGEWKPYEPDALHSGLDGFRGLRLNSVASAYATQQKALQAKYEREGEDVFVATHGMLSKDGVIPFTSFTVWSEGVRALLPRAENVVFTKPGSEGPSKTVAVTDWNRVRELVGNLMTPLAIYPLRFRVEQFPTDARLEQLGFAPGFEGMGQ